MLLSVVLTGGIVYQTTGSKYKSLIDEKDAAIALAQSKAAESRQAPPSAATTVQVAQSKVVCTICHDLEKTKGFHFVENIKLLNENRGKTPRICTTCHGSVPHNIHQKKISNGEMQCESCHVSPEGDFMVPQIPKGKLLVCEACHAFSGKPEDVGNYVSIHVVEAGKECGICHMGDPIKVHKAATEKLGLVNGSVYTTVK